MKTRGPVKQRDDEKTGASGPGTLAMVVQSGARRCRPPDECLWQSKYRELIRKHLSRLLDTLFAELTRLHFHIAWTQPSLPGGDARILPPRRSACCRQGQSLPSRECGACGRHRLVAALRSRRGHGFTCHGGIRNFWLPIRVRSETVGIAYLQALDHSTRRLRAGPGCAGRAGARPHRNGAEAFSQAHFARATRLLRLIVQHAQIASLSDLRKADLGCTGRAVVALERERERLRETLHRYLGKDTDATRRSGSEAHGQRVVRRLLHRVEVDYARPLTLGGLARELGMNAAYVSALFSRAVGVPFKTYVTELRLERAKELLGDSANTVSTAAYAVGYSSEERFRAAFKQATGLSPKVWRETIRTTPSGLGA